MHPHRDRFIFRLSSDILVDCALPLYDGQLPIEMLEDKVEIGEIMFTLQSDVNSEDASSQSKASPSTYS